MMQCHLSSETRNKATNLNPRTVSMLRRLSATDPNRLLALCTAMNTKELGKLPEDILETVRNFQRRAACHA